LPDTSFINCLILRGFRSSSSRSYYQRSPLVHFRSSRIMHSIELEGDLAAVPAHCRTAAVVVFLLWSQSKGWVKERVSWDCSVCEAWETRYARPELARLATFSALLAVNEICFCCVYYETCYTLLSKVQ
jgi:hypothetical protein